MRSLYPRYLTFNPDDQTSSDKGGRVRTMFSSVQLSRNKVIVGLHLSRGVVTSGNHNGEAAAAINTF